MKHEAYWSHLSSWEAEEELSTREVGTYLLHDLDEECLSFYEHLSEAEKEVDLSILSYKKGDEAFSHRFIVERGDDCFFYNDEVDFQAPYVKKYKNLQHLIASDRNLKYPLKQSERSSQ